MNGKPFVECLGVGLGAALYLLGEEIRSARLDTLINVVRRAYDYGHQDFALALDRSASDALKRNSTKQNHRLLRFLTRNQSSNLTLSAPMLTVSNGPYFGRNYAVAPEQRMDDGLLTVSVFSRYSKLQLWWHFASVAFGRRQHSPKSIAFRVAKLRINGPRKLSVHLDGSSQKALWPLDVECKQGALRVLTSHASVM